MKIKSVFSLLYSLFFSCFICYILYNNKAFAFIIIPFLLAGLAVFFKNVFILLEKRKLADQFNKLYSVAVILYAFFIISYFGYTSIADKNYGMFIVLVPFLFIVILIVRSKLFHKSNAFLLKYIPVLLVSICMIAGCYLFISGIKDLYDISVKTKGYVTTQAYFSEYDIYSKDEDGVTYQLIYQYRVNNEVYSIKTDYGSNYIPELNSVREVRYDVNDPTRALLIGTNSNNVKIFMGAFFMLGSFTFVLAYLYIKGYFDHIKIDVVGTYMAAVCILFGIGMIVIQTGTTLSLIKTIESFGLWILVPLILILAGVYLLYKNLFLRRNS